MIHTRQDLQNARRVVIKAGTSVVSTPEGYPSLLRMANIVECAARLSRQGKEVLIVTSGAVGVGKQMLRRQALLRQSMTDLFSQKDPVNPLAAVGDATLSSGLKSYNSACAAAGQLGLMSLYETMFSQFDITTSQLLLTSSDFASPERRRNIQHVISQLLSLGIVPLLNENDAVSANQGYDTYGAAFSDNDSLAALVSVEMSAQLLILLTDVKGVYDLPPSDPSAKLIDVFRPNSTAFKEGAKSTQGRGGMSAKVGAALNAIYGGVQAVVIAAGGETGVIDAIMQGEKAGTLFLAAKEDETDSAATSEEVEAKVTAASEELARKAREGGRQLQALESSEREAILRAIADAIHEKSSDILAVNAVDIKNAEVNQLDAQVLNRLKLTPAKIATLVDGIRSIANQTEPIGEVESMRDYL
jgi:delta-1-pyrroline-5-carboxylate synthetase